mmetsp:Transcript_2967/g.6876  ORF Transcript_2967/g.6876 Transcript_2967/m.6876 type:complete len:172 (-) Transcript_2967:395-910(-)
MDDPSRDDPSEEGAGNNGRHVVLLLGSPDVVDVVRAIGEEKAAADDGDGYHDEDEPHLLPPLLQALLADVDANINEEAEGDARHHGDGDQSPPRPAAEEEEEEVDSDVLSEHRPDDVELQLAEGAGDGEHRLAVAEVVDLEPLGEEPRQAEEEDRADEVRQADDHAHHARF